MNAVRHNLFEDAQALLVAPLFFALKLPGVAFVEIVLLWGFILATIVAAWSVRRVAAWLLVPYLAWVSFAATLNGSLWWLNRAAG